MKKFFLILFSEFESDENFDDILQVISPIVDSSFLKFVNHKGAMIIHFGSEVDQDEINEYLKGSFFGEIITFILTEYNDKMSLYMSKEILEHLLDLETNTGNGDIVIDINKYMDKYEMGEDNDDYVALLLEEVKSKIKKPSLDYILDKITTKGISSLSQYEKDILDSYSKN